MWGGDLPAPAFRLTFLPTFPRYVILSLLWLSKNFASNILIESEFRKDLIGAYLSL